MFAAPEANRGSELGSGSGRTPAGDRVQADGAKWWPCALSQAVFFFVLLTLGACAGLGGPPKLDGIRTLGIISAAGGTFEVRKIGLTVFNNDVQDIAVNSWGVDELIIGKTRGLLAKTFDIRPVTYQKTPFAQRIFLWNDVSNRVRAEASPQGLDAYLVVSPALAAYGNGNSNQSMHGLGILGVGLLSPRDFYLYAYYQIDLIDGHQFSSMGTSVGALPGVSYNPLFAPPVRGVSLKVDKSFWPGSAATVASDPRLKAGVIDLINQSLPNTLAQLHLTS